MKNFDFSILLFFVIIVAPFGCRPKVASELEGHITKYEEKQLSEFLGKAVLIPEYEPASGVILGARAFRRMDMLDFIRKLVPSKIRQVVISHPLNDSEATLRLKELAAQVKQDGLDTSITISTVPLVFNGQQTNWVRDYGPTFTRPKHGSGFAIADFNYDNDRGLDDMFNEAFARTRGLQRFQIPLYFEGGNLIVIKRDQDFFCLISDKVVTANSVPMIRSDRVFDRAKIRQMFEQYLGCTKVAIMPSMPHESTKHVDIWAKGFARGVIIVGEIYRNTLRYSNDRKKARDISQYLDRQALGLGELGLKVVRVPMPAPIFDTRNQLITHIFRSYTNSLILNDHVYIPRYIKPHSIIAKSGLTRYPDEHLLVDFEKKTAEVYRALGYKVQWINSDALIAYGGGIHCTTMQIPEMKVAPEQSPNTEGQTEVF